MDLLFKEDHKNNFTKYRFATLLAVFLELFAIKADLGNVSLKTVILTRGVSILILMIIWLIPIFKKDFFLKYIEFFMIIGAVSITMSASIIGALAGGIESYYFFAVVEVEIIFAFLFMIRGLYFIIFILYINLFYFYTIIFISKESFDKDFTNILFSLVIFLMMTIAIYIKKVKYERLAFIRRKELMNKKENLEYEVSKKTKEIESKNIELKQLQKRIFENEEKELNRIASDLHDDLGQQISYLGIKIKAIRNKFSKNTLKDNDFDIIKSLKDDIASYIRNLSHSIHPVVLERLNIDEVIKKYVKKYDSIDISVELKDIIGLLKHNEKINIYRIIQEALNNIVKHSSASSVIIDSLVNNTYIKIMIKDNGKGFDLNNINKSFSLGLITMRERIENINGNINVVSELNKGTQVELILKNRGSYGEDK